jgi:hypothetical protein
MSGQPDHKKFGGYEYKRRATYNEKSDADRVAKKFRLKDIPARVVKLKTPIGNFYILYTRSK